MRGHYWWMAVLFQSLLLASSLVPSFPHHVRGHRRLLTKEDFIDQCTASLLSDNVVFDDLISQDEFTLFLSDVCVELQVCEAGTSLDFTNLSVELQLAFVLFICNEPTEVERERCLEELVAQGGLFGYNVQEEEEREMLDTELEELCSLAYVYASRSELLPATIAPSPTPTVSPVVNDGENAGDGGDGTETNDPNGANDSEGPPVSSTNDSLSNGAIVGVALAAVVVVLVTAFLVSRRRSKRRRVIKEQDKYVDAIEIAGDESIFTEDSAAFKYIPKGMGSFHSAHSVASSSAKSSKRSSRSGSSVGSLPLDVTTGIRSRSVAQFDPGNSAAAIALDIDGSIIRRDSVGSSHKSSPMMSLDEGKHGNMKDLTNAIEHGDWDTVARLAGNMASDSESVSTISGYSSAREQLSSRSSKSSRNSDDSVVAAQIEEMVQRGDWSGVATAAQYFSSNRSQQSGTRQQGGAIPSEEPPKRSFLNFVTGRRSTQSAAATAAIVPNARDLVERDSETSEAGLAHVGAVEDLPSVLDTAALNNTMDTQSSSSHGSRQGNISDLQKPKRRWFGRLISARGSKKDSSSHTSGNEIREVQSSAHSSETALQAALSEALSRNDYGMIEAISAKLDEPGTRDVSSSARTSSNSNETDAILGARALSTMKKSPKRPGVGIASQRAKIDEAVTRGDWDTVEALTTDFLNTKPPALPRDIMADTLMSHTPSPSIKSSPFRDTPSSSEWSLSPVDKEVKSRKLRRLIEAKDWKGVNVLSGIYELEATGALPPNFASLSSDSAENPSDFASGWLHGGSSNTPPGSVEGMPHRISPGRPPPSPSTSTSTNNSNEIREFERLVNAKDWKGLASFAGAEDDIECEDDVEHDDSQLLPRNLFDIESLIPGEGFSYVSDSKEEGLDHVELRETEGPKFRDFSKNEDSDTESIHGAQKLIPHWEHKIEKHSPDASAERDDAGD